MGWGAKKIVASLQPMSATGLAGDQPIPEDDESFGPKITETPSQAHKDRMAYGSLIVRWAPETAQRFVLEFIAEEQLFGRLNAFLKRKIR